MCPAPSPRSRRSSFSKSSGLFLPNTLWLEIVIFFGAYIVLTVAVERALRRYGTKRR